MFDGTVTCRSSRKPASYGSKRDMGSIGESAAGLLAGMASEFTLQKIWPIEDARF